MVKIKKKQKQQQQQQQMLKRYLKIEFYITIRWKMKLEIWSEICGKNLLKNLLRKPKRVDDNIMLVLTFQIACSFR